MRRRKSSILRQDGLIQDAEKRYLRGEMTIEQFEDYVGIMLKDADEHPEFERAILGERNPMLVTRG
jgi:hypothetical protein